MSYQTLLENLKTGEEVVTEEVEINELTLGWLCLSLEERAELIKEVKEKGTDFTKQLLREIVEDAKANQEVYEARYMPAEEWDKLEAAARDTAKRIPKEEWGKTLKKVDDRIDADQALTKKLSNVPLIGKTAKNFGSGAGSAEAGIKAARATNALGASPETSTRVGIKVARGVEGAKEAADAVKGAAGKVGSAISGAASKAASKAEDVGEKLADFAKEKGGKTGAIIGASTAAGLGALALAKKLRAKKAESSPAAAAK
jgi:hypothetical protein